MNIQRFRQVLAYIEAHPQEWDQSLHVTKGPCCFAARACRIGRAAYGTTWLNLTGAEATWVLCESRTLDDFRTVARRPYA
jgi:hypothetical protein